MSAELDKGMVSPSDFCLMGTDIQFDEDEHYDKMKMEEIIKEKFSEKYHAEVEYINPAWKIDQYYKWVDEQIKMSKLKTLIEAYCEENGHDKDSFDGNDHSDISALKWPGVCCRKTVLMSDLKEKLEEVTQKIEDREKQVKGDGQMDADEKDKYTGVCFVIMKTPKDCQKVLEF